MISALVTAGIDAGYLVNSRLAKVHWQAGDRPLPGPGQRCGRIGAVGRSRPRSHPHDDVGMLDLALAAGVRGDRTS